MIAGGPLALLAGADLREERTDSRDVSVAALWPSEELLERRSRFRATARKGEDDRVGSLARADVIVNRLARLRHVAPDAQHVVADLEREAEATPELRERRVSLGGGASQDRADAGGRR